MPRKKTHYNPLLQSRPAPAAREIRSGTQIARRGRKKHRVNLDSTDSSTEAASAWSRKVAKVAIVFGLLMARIQAAASAASRG